MAPRLDPSWDLDGALAARSDQATQSFCGDTSFAIEENVSGGGNGGESSHRSRIVMDCDGLWPSSA